MVDLDGDGLRDILFSSKETGTSLTGWRKNNGDATFSNIQGINVTGASGIFTICHSFPVDYDLEDDFLELTLDMSFSGINGSYDIATTVGEPINTNVGNYDEITVFEFTEGTAGNGPTANDVITITVTDVQFPTAGTTLLLMDPGTCSSIDEVTEIIYPTDESATSFASEVSMNDRFMAINGSESNIGQVHLYELNGSTWDLDTIFRADNGDSDYGFGLTMDMTENHLLMTYDNNSWVVGGSIAFYKKDDNDQWEFEQRVFASDSQLGDYFGKFLSINQQHAVVSNQEGAIYIFEYIGDEWIEQQKLYHPNPLINDYFTDLCLAGNYIYAGMPNRINSNNTRGAVAIFKKNTNGLFEWLMDIENPDMDEVLGFGISVDASESYLIVSEVEKAYVYNIGVDEWTLLNTLVPPSNAFFGGIRVSLYNEQLVLNAGSTGGSVNYQGIGVFPAVYHYELNDNAWEFQRMFHAGQGVAHQAYSRRFAVNDHFIGVAARDSELNPIVENTGVVYLHSLNEITTSVANESITKANQEEVFVIPNPANDFVKIYSKASPISTIEFFDLNGIKINQINHTDLVPIADLNTGIYLLRITLDDGNVMSKSLIKY